ncbi:hypothetical protein [Nitrospirillum iridis]|uniref:Uncharacterized protein n=1 Tax=Nitrospirillum iridis TaxID=765888 RepID=A0A7X0B0C8_9PROT|nr:hypothetical protein [Nitrospirillum iridis]MBB6253022.1 hypothetical protein [Nitrospirillum iridis]
MPDDLTRLYQALRAADAAGNTEDARRLAEYIKSLPTGTDAPAGPEPDRSWGSALMSGVAGPVKGIGTTLEVTGLAPEWGKVMQGVPAPSNYEPAKEQFLHPRDGDATLFGYGVGAVPRMVAENAGAMAGDLAARGAGAVAGGALGGAAGGVVGSVVPGLGNAAGAATGASGGAIAGAIVAPAALNVMETLGPIAKSIAAHDGRDQVSRDDLKQAAVTAAASGLISAAALKFIPGLGDVAGSSAIGIAKSSAAGVIGGAASSAVTQAGSTAGTADGLSVDPGDMLADAVGSGATAAGVGAVRAAAAFPANHRAAKDYATSPEAFESANRVGQAYSDYNPTAIPGAPGADTAPSVLFRTMADNTRAQLNTAVEGLRSQGVVDDGEAGQLSQIVRRAGSGQRAITKDDLSFIDGLNLPGDQVAALKSSVVDLNTMTYSGLQKNAVGPVERAAAKFAPALGRAIGTGAGSVMGGWAGGITGNVVGGTAGAILPALGAITDRMTGQSGPPALRNKDRNAAFLERRGIDPGSLDDNLAALSQGLYGGAAAPASGGWPGGSIPPWAVGGPPMPTVATPTAGTAPQMPGPAAPATTGPPKPVDVYAIGRKATIDADTPANGVDREIAHRLGFSPAQVRDLRDHIVAHGGTPEDQAALGSLMDRFSTAQSLPQGDFYALQNLIPLAATKAGVQPRYSPDERQQFAPPPPKATAGDPYSPAMAQANANQARVTQASAALDGVQLPSTDLAALKVAALRIGASNNKADAQAVLDGLSGQVTPEALQAAQQYLAPLVAQIRHDTPEKAEAARKK